MYKEIVKISIKESFAYKSQFIGGIAGSMIQLVVLWFVWSAIFSATGGTIKGLTFSVMITYVTISTLLRTYGYSEMEFIIEDGVKRGFIANMLIKPFSYPLFCFFEDLGYNISSLVIRGFPIILIGFFALSISLPVNALAFIISAVLAFVINFFLVFLTGMWAFWTTGQIWGMRLARHIISDLLSGAIIPVFLFPEWLKNIAYMLPFQAVYNTPLSIYIGQISGLEIFSSIGIQSFWFIALLSVSYFVWKKAERKIVVHGG